MSKFWGVAHSFARTDYHFTSWNTAADGTGTSYKNGETITLEESMTLYAQWVEGLLFTAETIEMAGNIYNVVEDLEIDTQRITVSGSATLNLASGCTLILRKGIKVSTDGETWTVYTGSPKQYMRSKTV